MTISRGQMERQLRMGGGIMDVVPREPAIFGGIKKAVKKVGKTVGKIAKSDIGKAALIGAAAFGIPGTQMGGIFGRASFGGFAPGMFEFGGIGNALAAGKAKFFPNAMQKAFGKDALGMGDPAQFFSSAVAKGAGEGIKMGTVGKLATLGAVSTFLTKSLGMPPEQAEEEVARDPSKYLELYYRNLNPPTADTNSEQYEQQVRDFVATNTSEYAVGGRVGFADGPVLPPDPTQPVNPFGPKPIGPVLPNKMMASNLENDKILETLFEKYLDMGMSPKDAAEAAKEEFDRMSNKRIEETRGVAALGGRMGFDEGTKDPSTTEQGLMSLTDETIDIPMEDTQRAPSILNKFDDDYGDKVVIIVYDEMGNQQLKVVPKSEVMPGMVEGDSLPIVAPRNNKAKGDTASENAMQAAGIEGLPIRKNQAGVKELDLRETGGFIQPVGIKEKEDDIPAMLSNNEFVFTADAVRGMGGGDVNKGAQMLYDQMKMLEAGGRV
tara:strand:- start:161 stop:1639 length:1479 start_codon:yes stop_codon:yes gene_type:complete